MKNSPKSTKVEWTDIQNLKLYNLKTPKSKKNQKIVPAQPTMQSESKRLKIRTEVIQFATLPIVLKISPNSLLKSIGPFMVAPESTLTLEKLTAILKELISNFHDKDIHVLFLLYKIVVDGEDIGYLQKTVKRSEWAFQMVNARKFCVFMFLQSFRTNLDNRDGYNHFNESIRSNNRNAR